MIDINVMANIVAQTGATITGLETLIYKKEHHEKTIVDIGVLRFPDPDHPYFKVINTLVAIAYFLRFSHAQGISH